MTNAFRPWSMVLLMVPLVVVATGAWQRSVLATGQRVATREAGLLAEHLAVRAGDMLEAQVAALSRMARRYEVRRTSREEWQSDAQHLLGHAGGILEALEIVEPRQGVRFRVQRDAGRDRRGPQPHFHEVADSPGAVRGAARRPVARYDPRAMSLVPRGILAVAAATREPTFSQPLELSSGDTGVLLVVPFQAPALRGGAVIAAFDLTRLHARLTKRLDGHAVAVFTGGKLVAGDTSAAASGVDGAALIGLRGKTWTVRAVSTDPIQQPPLPLSFPMGALLTLVAGVVLYRSRVGRVTLDLPVVNDQQLSVDSPVAANDRTLGPAGTSTPAGRVATREEDAA